MAKIKIRPATRQEKQSIPFWGDPDTATVAMLDGNIKVIQFKKISLWKKICNLFK